MFVSCNICKYDSGNFNDCPAIAAKVIADGGKMEMAYDEHGKTKGWDIACPSGHDGDEIHLD